VGVLGRRGGLFAILFRKINVSSYFLKFKNDEIVFSVVLGAHWRWGGVKENREDVTPRDSGSIGYKCTCPGFGVKR